MSTSSTTIFLPAGAPEPERGSIVLLEGPVGTAYQRLHSDGRWHSTTLGAVNHDGWDWAQLEAKTARLGAFPVLLVHDPSTCRVGFAEDVVAPPCQDVSRAGLRTVQDGPTPPA